MFTNPVSAEAIGAVDFTLLRESGPSLADTEPTGSVVLLRLTPRKSHCEKNID